MVKRDSLYIFLDVCYSMGGSGTRTYTSRKDDQNVDFVSGNRSLPCRDAAGASPGGTDPSAAGHPLLREERQQYAPFPKPPRRQGQPPLRRIRILRSSEKLDSGLFPPKKVTRCAFPCCFPPQNLWFCGGPFYFIDSGRLKYRLPASDAALAARRRSAVQNLRFCGGTLFSSLFRRMQRRAYGRGAVFSFSSGPGGWGWTNRGQSTPSSRPKRRRYSRPSRCAGQR